jgi:4,5-dihydroxyphthalate decarboxylase
VTKPRVVLAIDNYDRHAPLLDGSVRPTDLELVVLEVGQLEQRRHGAKRHERMLVDGEFDCAEVSLCSFLMARDRGAQISAIPVFPRRLFSPSQVFVNRAAGIHHPGDLARRRVALTSYQTTLAVQAKGDLEQEYGLALRDVIWVTDTTETIPWKLPPGVRVEQSNATSASALLAAGEVAAAVLSRVPEAVIQGDARVGRLFADARAEELKYFQRRGYMPVMHVIAFHDGVLSRAPSAGSQVMAAFVEAKDRCRRNYDDAGWSSLAWGRHYVEEERRLLAADPWPDGFAANQANLRDLIRYAHTQGLIDREVEPETLFVGDTLSS